MPHQASLRSTYWQGCRVAKDLNHHLTALSIPFEGHAGRSSAESNLTVLGTGTEEGGLLPLQSEAGMHRAYSSEHHCVLRECHCGGASRAVLLPVLKYSSLHTELVGSPTFEFQDLAFHFFDYRIWEVVIS